MAKPRFPGKPQRLLSRNRTRIPTFSNPHDDDTLDVIGNICFGLGVFKQSFPECEEPHLLGQNDFKGFTTREVSASKSYAKRKYEEAKKRDFKHSSTPNPLFTPIPLNITPTIEGPKNEKEDLDDGVIGVPSSKKARRKGGGRKSISVTPKQESPAVETEVVSEIKQEKPEPSFTPVASVSHEKQESSETHGTGVSLLPSTESPLSWVGHPLIVEGKRRWKPTYKVLQGPSVLEESRRLGGEAWPLGARQMGRAVEAPAPLGGKFVTGSGEKEYESKGTWKSCSSTSNARPSGGGILREARLRLDSAATGTEDGEWVRRMMDDTDKNKPSVPDLPKPASQSSAIESGSPDRSVPESEISRVYCRICKGAMSRRFSKRKMGKRGVWSCKACREFAAEMTKKLRNNKNTEGSNEAPASTVTLTCRGGKGKCQDEENWPPAPPQRCVPCWLRLCLNAPPPHLIPCPVSRAALRKQLPFYGTQPPKEPGKRGKKRRGSKFVHLKSKRQKVAAEGPRVKHVCRSALAVLGRPPATFPAREPLKTQGGEASTGQESSMCAEVKEAEGSARKQEGDDKLLEGNEASSPPPPVNSSGGAHQWWKQRKGMHRRRKKGRLSLALPRRDGKLSLHRPIPKSPPVVKPPHLAKATKDVGPPLKLEGYPFRADAAEVFTNGYGVIQVAPNIMPVKPVCFLCGSGGKQWLVHCALCCEPFHTFCVEWAGWDIFDGWDVPSTGPPKGFKSLEWMCRRCSLCHACGLPAYMPGGGMPSVTSKKKLKAIEKKGEEDAEKKKKKDDEEEEMEDMGTRTCNLCHRCYHGACLGSATENQKSNEFALFKDRETPWVCSSCLKCHSCRKPTVAGSVPKRSSEKMKEGEHAEPESGPEDLLMCAQCLSLHRKGNYCPLCHVVYRDTDFDALMMQCAQCSSWVHASCEGLTDDQYHLLSLLPSSIEFTCSPCTTTPHPAWRKALEKKLRQGLERILEILVEAVNARKSSSLPPPLSPGVPSEPLACYSDIPTESFDKILENLPKYVDKGDSSRRELANLYSCPDDALDKRSKESDAVDYSGKSDINNEDNTKVSIVLDKSEKVASAKAANILLELKKKISCGDFSDPSDFSKAVQCYFQDDELVISTLRGALAKVFPSVKPKFFPRDVSKKIELLLTDHSYTCTSKTSDLLKRLPKVEDKENDTKNIASGENNVKFTFSCDLKSNAEGSEKASDKNCALKELGENTSKSKECPTQKENLWMDPSDYIPNLKVYSFASALRRRSRNNTVLRLSTKDFEHKNKPVYTPSEKELNMTLENSRSIVTYKSVLAGIKKECSESDNSANEKMEKSNEKNVVDESKEIPEPQEQQTVPECTKSEAVQEGIAESLPSSKENDNQNCCHNEVTFSEVGGSLSEVSSSKDDQKVYGCAVPQNTSMHCIGVEESRSGVDARRCLFCHVRGDADVEREGRLLLASSFGDWVHCNCALWSAEVYEEKGGLLMKVREAVNRGRRVRCALCRETGATLGCCLRGCPDSFHLGCAFRSGCLLLEDKSVYCRNHIPADKAKESNVEMSLKRPVQVDTEGRKGSVLWRWKKPGRAKRKPGDNGTTFAAGSLKFTVGSLHVECLGKIVPGNVQGQFIRPPEGKKSDNEGEMRWCEGGVSLAKKDEKDSKVPEMMAYGGPVVVPVGFRCTRLYWSSVEPWKVIEYYIQTVLVISETDEAQLAVTEEKEEKQNEEHDFHAHVTVDHTAEAEDDSRGAEQTDLIIPADSESVKDLSSEFFPSKKLMQSIVGLLKGANNSEIQNSVSHHTFEDGEDGKTLKNLSDKENSISPNGLSLSDQNIQVPRNNKPMNVVQLVSKETLLTTESASRAWELTCEMRAAQTPPPSASPTMTGAAGNTSGITSIIKSQNKPEIWCEGSKELWKHLRPISQLDGNADPSSSSSEGGGSSPVRSSPSREPDQALPCLLACRIKQQSLARSEPGGGGPVKCKDCRRTYRTREGYERHLCGTPLPLSSTSSDSDSEDRTSRRVSSESDVPNISEDTVPQANDMFECYNEFSGKAKTLDENLNSKTDDDHTSCLVDNAEFNKDCHTEKFSPISNDEISVNHMASNTTETCQSKEDVMPSFDSNPNEVRALMGDESQNVEANCSSSDQSKELNNLEGEKDTIYPHEDDTSAKNSTKTGALDSICSNSVSSENEAKNSAKNTVSSLVQGTKEMREGVWKGSTSDACTNKSTKRQMAKVQPVCYVNGTRRIQSAELLEASKAARLAISQEETLICNNQQINQGGIPQTSIITAPIQPQGAGNFQVLVRQLPSSSAVPQFAENFRQQTGHTLQYLATIDPNTFTQPNPLTQPQNLVGLIQGAPQIMQTQTLVSSQQMVASSPIVLAPQQQAIVYNPVTACIEALPHQQPNYILTPPTYTIPVSTPLSYGIPQEVSQVYFQSTPQPTVPPQPQAPQLEPVIQNEVGWTLPSGYHIVQNHPVEQHPQTVIQPQQLQQVIASSVPSTVNEEPLSGPVAQMMTVPIQSSLSTAKKKRILLPNNKVREGYMAYRRDERTGKYVPVEEGWEESLGLPIQKNVIEDGGVRSGLSPAVFPVEGKDCSSKDGRKRPIARKGDGVNVQGSESVDSQGSPKRWVRAKLTSQFRSPSSSACDSFETIVDPANPNFGIVNRTGSAGEQVSLRTERVPKRIESAAVMYQIRSADGLTIQSDTPDKMWSQVFNSVQEARVAYGLAPLPRNPFAPIYGSKPFMGAETLALSHKGLRYLLNQLPGASQLLETKQSAPEVPSVAPPPHKLFSRAHLSLSTQTPVEETPSIPLPPSSPPLPENPSGCARTEAYKMPPPFPGGHSSTMGNRKWRHRDIFGWLASPHRKLPMAPLPTQDSEPNGGGNRRATSLDLPMAMRFRHLKETSRETVGVYRSHIHGRGLFCLKDIEAGEMVIEYSGEVIRSSLTDTREKTYEAKGMGCYMFRIDEQTVVDATMRGNAARFINHSCDPNCYSRVVDILGKKHILIFALRRIPRGEELTYDYKFPFEDVKIPCHCASKRCRKYLN